jgi:GTPase
MTRAGFVAVVGRPNAGKSTLLNRLVGQKLSITSAKPQSTRDRVVGIVTTGDSQMVFLDTPGLLDPRYPLQHAMRRTALRAVDDADVIVFLLEPSDVKDDLLPRLQDVAALPTAPTAPVLTVINKCDTLSPTQLAGWRARWPDALYLSALRGDGVDALRARLEEVLPEGPFLYPADDLSTQSMRFFVSELVRETALEQLDDEVPYSVACEVEEFRETDSPVYIRAVIYVERDSQKRILIGEKGQRIRAIGTAARAKVEALVGGAVYLDLWVKVLHNWRRDVNALRRLGYRLTEESPS